MVQFRTHTHTPVKKTSLTTIKFFLFLNCLDKLEEMIGKYFFLKFQKKYETRLCNTDLQLSC